LTPPFRSPTLRADLRGADALRDAALPGGDPMDLRLTEDEIAFRAEVRAFLRDNLPASIREKGVAGRGLLCR
jgi:hypothetical protein